MEEKLKTYKIAELQTMTCVSRSRQEAVDAYNDWRYPVGTIVAYEVQDDGTEKQV